MKKTTSKTKTKRRPKPAVGPLTEGINIGKWRLVRFGKENWLWLFHWQGEAMFTNEAQLDAALERFWKRHF